MDSEYKRRHARALSLPEIGLSGQKSIAASSVLVVGAGALGNLAVLLLAGAGIGKITIADFDTVDISNLHRQPAFSTDESGKLKAEILAQKAKALNPDISVTPLCQAITKSNIVELAEAHTLVLECSDNAATKHLVTKKSIEHGKVCISGGVSGWKGQIVILTPDQPTDTFVEIFGNGLNLSCGLTGCSGAAVAGPAAAVISAWQAAEALKYCATYKIDSSVIFIDISKGETHKLTL